MVRKKASDGVVDTPVQVIETPAAETPVLAEVEAPKVEEIKPEIEVKTEPVGEVKIEVKEEIKTEISPETKVEVKPEIKPEVKPVAQQRPMINRAETRVEMVRPKFVPPVRVATPPQIDNTKMEPIVGILDVTPEGQGFVRPKFIPNHRDAVIASMQLRKYGLRPGDHIAGIAKAPKDGEKYWGMVRIDKVNGGDLMSAARRPEFRDLVPVYPEKQLKLETDPKVFSTRIIDLFSPIGFGQRGMVVSPPKAGKTTLLKEIAAGVAANYPNVHLMAVLVGERPEEVTDMQRFIKGEVIASHFDQKPEEQTKAAEIAIERAKRLVELGKDVFVVFDSITRLARAYNLAIPTSGRTLSGGFDPAALYPSKRFFGAARKIENGGSLTIMGTALVDTGSKMDELIFEEFKGTGNMELWLLRELAERRIFPAFDIMKSGTRNEDLLLDQASLMKIVAIRRMFDAIAEKEGATERIIEQLNKTKSNADFLAMVGKK